MGTVTYIKSDPWIPFVPQLEWQEEHNVRHPLNAVIIRGNVLKRAWLNDAEDVARLLYEYDYIGMAFGGRYPLFEPKG